MDISYIDWQIRLRLCIIHAYIDMYSSTYGKSRRVSADLPPFVLLQVATGSTSSTKSYDRMTNDICTYGTVTTHIFILPLSSTRVRATLRQHRDTHTTYNRNSIGTSGAALVLVPGSVTCELWTLNCKVPAHFYLAFSI